MRRFWCLIAGALAVAIYLAFATAAFLEYPTTFSPLNNNWLSDLGDRIANPHGAIYYRVGCAVAGALVATFFAGLGPWHTAATRRQRRLAAWTQVFGVAAGIAFVLTAIYPIDDFEVHQLWSRVMFGAFAGALFVSAMAFARPGQPNRALTVVAIAGWVTIGVWLAFGDQHWIEWIAVALLLAWVLLLVQVTARHAVRTGNTTSARPTTDERPDDDATGEIP